MSYKQETSSDLLSGGDNKLIDHVDLSSSPSSLARDHSLDDFEHIQGFQASESPKPHENILNEPPVVDDLLGFVDTVRVSSSDFNPPIMEVEKLSELAAAVGHQTLKDVNEELQPIPISASLESEMNEPELAVIEPAIVKQDPIQEVIKPVISEKTAEILKPVNVTVEVPSAPKPIPEVTPAKVAQDSKAVKIGCSGCIVVAKLAQWFNPECLPPTVANLVYWRDPKKSGGVFGVGLVILLSLVWFSLISVLAYTSIISLLITTSFRIYKSVLQAVQKTQDGHPFKEILEFDLVIPSDKVHSVSDIVVGYVNSLIQELRRLFLVEDLVDSLKFGLLLWCLTYIGGWFNGLTLVILAFVAAFTLPKVYETNKTQIDQNLDLVKKKLDEVSAKVRAAVPLGKKDKDQ